MTYSLKFTHAAEVTLAARGLDRAEIEAHIRRDVDHCGCDDPMDLMFHTVPMTPSSSYFDDACWFVRPGEDGNTLLVDLAESEVMEMKPEGNFAEGGPFHGMKVSLPKPFTDEDE